MTKILLTSQCQLLVLGLEEDLGLWEALGLEEVLVLEPLLFKDAGDTQVSNIYPLTPQHDLFKNQR